MELHVHNVLIACQHQAGVHLAARTRADLGRAFAGDLHDFGRNEGPRRKVQTRIADGAKLAKEELNRLFFGLDGVERGIAPKCHRRKGAQRKALLGKQVRPLPARTATAATRRTLAATAHQHAQLLLPFAHQLVDFRDLRSIARTTRTALATLVPAFAPIIILIAATAAPGPTASRH